ncbi:ABC transporter permease [Cytophagaceae bacterium DM2B3-1]|uniref:ABC transporter permease n=1 Tax=Xanthocytophaga flava TaxID=3048013 RepID=A0ABT7CLT1_9BACT|nr:ABC transporter permease [Xanthocytophaga flavus]MDJ1494704.1 ABC transporter permease [Xanthocytophaga flavus]
MLYNYLKITIRTLFRNKLYTSLNIAGLTFGLTCFLLIGIYLFDELTFDQQHSKADRIYRVIEYQKNKSEELTIAATSYNMAEESKKNIAEIENTSRITLIGRDNISNPESKTKFLETIGFANQSLMEIFDFEAIDGTAQTALQEPNSIVLVEELARKLFNTTHVVGKTLKFDFLEAPLRITAVLKNHPSNSSFDFNLMISEATILHDKQFSENMVNDWSSHNYMVYALLKENANPQSVSQKITRFVLSHQKPEAGTTLRFRLQPLADMHLYSEDIVDGARNPNVSATGHGSLLYIKIFALVAVFMLTIAAINYINLTTARASNRSKEIGVRKATGATDSHLIRQFLFESLLVTLMAFALSVLLVNIILPAFNTFTGKHLSFSLQTDYRIWLYAILTTLSTAIVSGSYPALLLSRLKPVALLKNVKLHSKTGLPLRKSLVVFQFTVSVVMMIATMVLFLQVQYANNKNLGFNKDLLVVVDINSGQVRKEAETIKTEFGKIAGVNEVSVTSRVPGEWKSIPTVKVKTEGNAENPQVAYVIGADENFAKTFEVQLLKGRIFTSLRDSSSVILNETAARVLHIQEASYQLVEIPEMAFGGKYFPVNESKKPFKARVIGIVKDFHFQSLREKIAPLVLAYSQNPVQNIDYFTARIEGKNIQNTLKQMENTLIRIDPNHLFEYHFLDQQLARFYADDQRRETLLIWAALATIFIACLGLFGLATYAAEQRIKEIGIRKVLGADVLNLTALLSRDFLKLVLIANVLAAPIAWWASNLWLQEFAYHISLSWWVFAGAAILSFLIALATVSYQAIKAAIANPVKSLRSE